MSGAVAWWLAAETWPVFDVLRLEADALDALAARRLARLFRAASRTAFYRERLDAAGVDLADPALARVGAADVALAALPLVSKSQLREAGAAALAGGRVATGWRSSRSSGSTGEPFEVHYDPRAWATLKYLVKLRARLECGMRLADRVASLEAVSGAASRAGVAAAGTPSASWGRRFAQLDVLRPAAENAEALRRFAPDVVTGLPSALLETGEALAAAGRPLAVRAVFTGGELLQRTTRGALERRYGARVFDVYGTSETKEIAWECRLGGMHVNADVVRVEVVDPGGRPVPPGREGEIVATLLVNHAMPLLRYRTGDYGSLLGRRCPCGRATPLLGVVTGREADTLVLAGGRRVSPYALTCALEQVPGLARYQVVQLGPARLAVRAIAGDADRPRVADQVRAALRSAVAPHLDVEVEFVDNIPTGPRAKLRVVQRMEAP